MRWLSIYFREIRNIQMPLCPHPRMTWHTWMEHSLTGHVPMLEIFCPDCGLIDNGQISKDDLVHLMKRRAA